MSNGFCDVQHRCQAMVDMIWIRPLKEGQGTQFGTNRFLIYDFL